MMLLQYFAYFFQTIPSSSSRKQAIISWELTWSNVAVHWRDDGSGDPRHSPSRRRHGSNAADAVSRRKPDNGRQPVAENLRPAGLSGGAADVPQQPCVLRRRHGGRGRWLPPLRALLPGRIRCLEIGGEFRHTGDMVP